MPVNLSNSHGCFQLTIILKMIPDLKYKALQIITVYELFTLVICNKSHAFDTISLAKIHKNPLVVGVTFVQ